MDNTDRASGALRRIYSGILSYAPAWPVHDPCIYGPHFDLFEHCDSSNDAEAEGNKQRDATCVARADSRHERLRPDAERVSRVGQEKPESGMCAALSTVRWLCAGRLFQRREMWWALRTSYHDLTLDLKLGIVALMLEKKVHIADHGQCLDVVVCKLDFGIIRVVGNVASQWASEYDKGELWGSSSS
jgi:hypothetical protein